VSTTGPSHVFRITRGAIDHQVVEPEEFGVARVSIEALRGGGIEDNRRIAEAILSGERGAGREIVLVNCAVALSAAGLAASPAEAMAQAAQAIDTGAARAKLAQLIEFTRNAV
jgi:anthranilate phosphoribosyltransferase